MHQVGLWRLVGERSTLTGTRLCQLPNCHFLDRFVDQLCERVPGFTYCNIATSRGDLAELY